MRTTWIVLFCSFALTACSSRMEPVRGPSAGESPTPPPAAERDTATPETAPPAVPSPSPTNVPQRTTWLLLGGDDRVHRHGTGWGDKTDVMLLVSILETDPIDVVIVQFPRNLYVPWPGHADTWMFAVYEDLGTQEFRHYIADVFGIVPQGLFWVDMDGFVEILDGLGNAGYPLLVDTEAGGKQMRGLEALAYLRDNQNNWEIGSYDSGQRVFRVFRALVASAVGYLGDEPVEAVDLALDHWGSLVETDQNPLQMYFLARIAVKLLHSDYKVRYVQLEEPWLMRGDTPIQQNHRPTRGMIANVPSGMENTDAPRQVLTHWMLDCVFAQSCEADPE